MLSQDPWDEMIDLYAALNVQVAKVACEENIGQSRHQSLKIIKTFNAMRLLAVIDTSLNVYLKDQIKQQKKNLIANRKKMKQHIFENVEYDSTAQYGA